MRGIKPILATVLAFAPALLPTPPAPLRASAPTTTSETDATPAACITKTRIVPRTPGWAFVVNFDVFSGNPAKPIGCLIMYRVVYAPTDFVEMPCITVGAVAYGGGRAALNGGYVYCEANIKQTLGALSPPIVITDTADYPYFTIVAAGAYSRTTGVSARGNPIGYYQPNTTTVPGLGLFAPILPNERQIRTEFNGVENINVENSIVPGKIYTFGVAHAGGPDVFTTTHYLGYSMTATFSPRGPVRFYTNGGAFWIGVAPQDLTETFVGTLDEVIFDPPDGGRPPNAQSDNGQYLSFTPLVMR
jgi:hypothetical protein